MLKYEKNLNFLESFERKQTFRDSRTKTSWKFEEKMKKENQKNYRNKIKLMKLRNRKKENLKSQKIGKEFKEKWIGI